MRWAHLITPMCQILNVIITSCISFVLVHFYYLICCFIFVIFLSGHDRLRPNEMNLAPNLGRCAAHLGGTALRLLDKYIHLPQGSKLLNFFFVVFFFNLSVLPYFKPVNASEWKMNKNGNKSEHSCFNCKGGSIGHVDFFEDFGTSGLSSRNYLSGIQ